VPKGHFSISYHLEMTGLGKMPKKGQKMAKFWFSSYNFGTDGPRDLKFGLLASPGDGLPQTRTISDILDFGPCITCSGLVSTNLKLHNSADKFCPFDLFT